MRADGQTTVSTSADQSGATAFLQARDFLLANRSDYAAAYEGFRWPQLTRFNWAIDYFDVMAEGNTRPALIVTKRDSPDQTFSFAEMRERSNQVANLLLELGVSRGERLLVMLGNEVALWEIMLAALKIGGVVVPTSSAVHADEIQDRIVRGRVQHVISNQECAHKFDTLPGGFTRLLVGAPLTGWTSYQESYRQPNRLQHRYPTTGSDPFLLYFTSGTTAKPKLVLHSQDSYPVGHLSTMYWIGVMPGDTHWNISAPGWAKHAWSSFFAPWNAEACTVASNDAGFNPSSVLTALSRIGVTTLCAPPTAWKILIKEELRKYKVHLREAVSAGEPLNPEVIRRVQDCWGLIIRDGYGQTETTALVANTPGQSVRPGSMGRALPGYRIQVLDSRGDPSSEGKLCVDCRTRPLGLMIGYESQMSARSQSSAAYHETGDIATIDAEGYIFFVGRADDVFKSSDYRISPFELESVAIRHPAVLEAAVVPSPDPIRLVTPKAFITLALGYSADADTARSIFSFLRENLSGYKRIRRIEFSELPKTSSGKIRRNELKQIEQERIQGERRPFEYFEQDFRNSSPSSHVKTERPD